MLRLLHDLNRLTKRIDSKKKLNFDDFDNHWETQYIIERLTQNAVQCCIDIGARIIAKKKAPAAQSSKDIFRVLQEEGWLPPSLTKELIGLVHLRNELTHEYRDILPQDVFTAFGKINKPLRQFQKIIKRLIR